MVRTLGAALLALLLLPGCGGGGGSSRAAPPAPPPAAPFGLTQRAPLAPLNLPDAGLPLGTFDVVNRFPNLSFPAALFFAGVPGENRVVVVQQSGFVRAFVNDAAATQSSTVLDLSGRVEFSGEQGLLGLAFDPDFVQNRFFYVHYSRLNPRRSVIARFTWDAASDAAALASEKILLEVPQPLSNHNGGMLAFGPDDLLYIGFGDGGGGGDPDNNAQNPSNFLGSMLRIDPHPADPADPYGVPAGNPVFSQPGARPETWAIGFRNPFRFSFDRATGSLWLGDVGQNAVEEIDIVTAGGNYGWRVFEGSQPFDGSANSLPDSAFTPPVHEYGHPPGVSVIGGYVYRGNALPTLQGRYVFADFGPGTIWALEQDAGTVLSNVEIGSVGSPTSFGEDNAGELYVVSASGGVFGFEESGGGGGDLPDRLSETGLFDSLASLDPASGLIEYELNQAFWSDGTVKRRWVGIPDAARIGFAATGPWVFPVGTVIVKHFEIELTEGDPGSRRRLETRLLLHTASGWQGFTYRWSADGSDATLLTGRETETISVNVAGGGARQQLYEYPSRTDCLGCHTNAAGRTLGLEARQLNRDFAYPAATDNQLRSWNNIALFTSDIGAASTYQRFAAADDAGQPLAARARAYLHVNCAQCHRPGGPSPGGLDLRFDTALAAMGAVDEVPVSGDLGITDARIVAPGDRARSVLWERMVRLDGPRMPPLASHLVDERGAALVGDWIDSL